MRWSFLTNHIGYTISGSLISLDLQYTNVILVNIGKPAVDLQYLLPLQVSRYCLCRADDYNSILLGEVEG